MITEITQSSPAITGHLLRTEPVTKDSARETGGDTSRGPDGAQLSDSDQKRLRELQARDREVRAHEQAHLSAAGGHAKGGASYTYERGPDQRMYDVGGEVQVDTSKVANDPVATLRKAQVIRRAALAPVNPSAQDRQVAADAARMEAEARTEIASEKTEESTTIAHSDSSSNVSKETDRTESCPACGGAHAVGAHDGMTAYAAADAQPTKDLIATT